MPKKSFKFVLNREKSIVTFNLSVVLLLAKVDPITKKKIRKKDAFEAYSSNHIRMILTLLTKIIALYM